VNFAFIRRLLPKSRTSSSPSPSRPPDHLRLGARGERVAARHLRRGGHRILARNYKCPVGEIDLVTLDRDTLVFVEVKTRASDEHADPKDAAGLIKWGRVERAARHYLRQHHAENSPSRFDLVTVLWPAGGKPQTEHFEDVYQVR